MSSKQGWVQLPLEPAAPWLRLSTFARCLGADLFRVWQERVIDGISAAQSEDVIVRMLAPDPRERKALRSAVRSVIDAGLIVDVEGGIKLLYGAASYADHARKVHASSTYGLPKVDASSTDGMRMVDASSTDGAQTVPAKSLKTLDRDLQREREKERERESERAPEAPHTPRPEPVDRVPEPEQGFTARRMAVAFVAEYEAVQRSTPNMGGKHVGDLHATVLRTAELQRVDPSALFVATVRTWLSKPLTERERQSPYACFTQAWGGLTGAGKRDVRKGFVEPAPPSAFTNPTNLDDVFGPEKPPKGKPS